MALLELERPATAAAVPIGDSDSVFVGDQVFVVGAPLGQVFTLTVGYVSARRNSPGMLGGATSTIGSGAATGVLRNLDRLHQEGLDQPPVHYETFPLGDVGGTQLAIGCAYPDIDTQEDIGSTFTVRIPIVSS